MNTKSILRVGAFLAASFLVKAQASLVQVPAPPIYPSVGAPVIEAQYIATNQTATITTFNLQCPSPSQGPVSSSPGALIQTSSNQSVQSVICPAGLYEIRVVMRNTPSTNGGGTVTNTVGWTDTATAQTANTAGTLTESTGNYVSGSKVFHSDGSANITFATSQSSTGNYDAFVTLVRYQ